MPNLRKRDRTVDIPRQRRKLLPHVVFIIPIFYRFVKKRLCKKIFRNPKGKAPCTVTNDIKNREASAHKNGQKTVVLKTKKPDEIKPLTDLNQ